MRIVLICGRKGSGKDTFANLINGVINENSLSGKFSIKKVNENINNLDYFLDKQHTPIVKFANPLKESVLYGLMGLTNNEFDNYEKIKDKSEAINYNGTIRNYMIAVAEVVREIDEDFFVKRMYQNLLNNENQNFMCTDWRYPNEYEYLKSKKVEIIKIRINRSKNSNPFLDHKSETSLDNYPMDYIIDVIE